MSAEGYFADSDHEFINRIVLLCQNNILAKDVSHLYFNSLTKRF